MKEKSFKGVKVAEPRQTNIVEEPRGLQTHLWKK